MSNMSKEDEESEEGFHCLSCANMISCYNTIHVMQFPGGATPEYPL